jgi:hypothetical protein
MRDADGSFIRQVKNFPFVPTEIRTADQPQQCLLWVRSVRSASRQSSSALPGSDLTAGEQFWVVKHGVKNDRHARLGVTHSDELLWDVVALLRKLPELTKEQYEALVENAPKHDELMQEMGGGHQHGGKHE